ncbi:hypothetical protein KSX_84740 [Ktedonospora formicarum]|uniref:Uncharacterized protein n=1 Tax=Ktedonospora formicarum TaxID=2778364 RepID=A0A8J3IAA0_9CHLR|nr:hypothetical protein KSX_84740 [Ktedonospora formicarum]
METLLLRLVEAHPLGALCRVAWIKRGQQENAMTIERLMKQLRASDGSTNLLQAPTHYLVEKNAIRFDEDSLVLQLIDGSDEDGFW